MSSFRDKLKNKAYSFAIFMRMAHVKKSFKFRACWLYVILEMSCKNY